MPQVFKYEMEIQIPVFLNFYSVCCVASVTPPSCQKPVRGFVSAVRRALFNPKCPNAKSAKAVFLLLHRPQLEVAAINLVKVHLHHVDSTVG